MIVPRTRLLLWVAAVGLPSALLMAAEPAARAIALCAFGGLSIVVLLDGLAARARLAGISVQLPELTRMTKDRAVALDLHIRNEAKRAVNIRIALSFPRPIRVSREELYVSLPPNEEWSACSWSCVAARRGSYRVGSANIETGSHLGFWSRRVTLPLNSEVRVYPNLFTERRELATSFLNRGSFGVHAQRQLGKGREFEKLREYVPGDGYDEIHWKATARRARPITKVFQLERTQDIYIIIDASRLSARPAGSSGPGAVTRSEEIPNALERFITAALVLGLAAERQGDLFGLLTFSDRVEKFVRARNGKAHYHACRDAIYSLEPRLVAPDFDELFTFIRQRLRRRALLLFLTALDDPLLAETFLKKIDLICRQHLVAVSMLQPPGIAPAFKGPDPTSLDQLYQRLGGQVLWNELEEVRKALSLRGVHFSLLQNERLSTDLISQYVAIKQRQML